uniref:Uncharacterized protein n=1 Tax=Picea glauca TaxID=3330 RepID=A0A101LZ31_PICGL|nr:hypothetical protein ABT39_MTgene4842 [Picea glauca]QHR88669.1 hypothetical protein Q903MT_gene2683 [Picea sitchensis]
MTLVIQFQPLSRIEIQFQSQNLLIWLFTLIPQQSSLPQIQFTKNKREQKWRLSGPAFGTSILAYAGSPSTRPFSLSVTGGLAFFFYAFTG